MQEELINFIGQTVRENFEKHQTPTTGAKLAERVRARFPATIFADAGFEKLGDAVREASKRGLVVRNHAVEHLEVFPPDVPFQCVKPPANYRSQYIRSDAWRAFAMQVESQFVYYNRLKREFEIRRQATADNNLLEVSPPTSDDFRQWTVEFAKVSNVSVPVSILQSIHCLRDFSVWVGKQNDANAADWKKFRAAKVVQKLTQWGKQSGIDTTDFLTPVASQAKRELAAKDPAESIDNGIKSAVIACIQDMSLAEIESLSIPLRHILTHFRPRS